MGTKQQATEVEEVLAAQASPPAAQTAIQISSEVIWCGPRSAGTPGGLPASAMS